MIMYSVLQKEEVEKEIQKGKEDKEKKIKEMEKTVDSHFRNQSEDDDHKTWLSVCLLYLLIKITCLKRLGFIFLVAACAHM